MECKDCPYWVIEIDEYGVPTGYGSCIYVADDGYAPCEVEDNEESKSPRQHMLASKREVDTNNARVAERRLSMKCTNCGYWYADVDERSGVPVSDPYCHYPYDDDYAPCSADDYYEEPEYDELD